MQQVINTKQYLIEFILEDAHTLQTEWPHIENKTKDENFKILKITANRVDEVIAFMTSKSFFDTYNKATHWFVVVINIIKEPLQLGTEHLSVHQGFLSSKKPIIIQWESTQPSERLIYFRKSDDKYFGLLDLSNTELLTEDELTSQDDFQFPLLLKALQSNLGGSFNGNLLDTTIDIKQEFDTWRLIDYVARSDDCLTLRFLMLLPWNIDERNGDGRKVLEIATEYGSFHSLAAILDMPMLITPETEVSLTAGQLRLLQPIQDVTTDTPVVIAVEKGKTDTLTFLINCGIDINSRCKTALGQYLTLTELAWNKQRYDNMLVLLKADMPYPNNINQLEEQTGATIALKEFTDDIVNFHQALCESNTERIESFIKRYPRLKKVHDLNNQSALMTALEAHQYETFTLLQSKGFTVAENENLFNSYEMLTDQQKEDLKVAKLKYFKKQDNTHILFLLSKSKVHLREIVKEVEHDYFALIKDLFEQLDDVTEMCTIMKVLEHSESVEINFYFNNELVVNLETKTIHDYEIGRLHIIVEDSYETIHRLAHELISLAIQNVYKNDLKPYSSSNRQTESQFKEIITKCRNNLNHIDSIIGKIFTTYQNVRDWTSELIVSVPLCSIRCEEIAKPVRNQAPELFSFYENHVQKDFLNFIKNPQHFKLLHKIQHLNDLLGEVHRLQQSGIWLKEECLLNFQVYDSQPVMALVTNLPQLVQADIYQTLDRVDSELNVKSRCIFAALSHFKNRTQAREIFDCYQSFIKPILIVDCSQDYNAKERDLWATIENFREKNRIILIIRDTMEASHIKHDISIIERSYNWNNLKIGTQNLILERFVDFQGYNISLNELTASNKCITEFFPLEVLIHEKEKIKLGKVLSSPYGYDESYYIPRTFNSQLLIKDAIISDKASGIYKDHLAYSEKEFSTLCYQYPQDNVHWLAKESTGHLFWQKSRCQHGFHRFYEYIERKHAHVFTHKNIDNFLKRARHQKVMIISDVAGMGKTFALTYLSKLIKMKYPTHWVLLLNLSMYIEEFKKQTIENMEVAEFIIEHLLKSTSPQESLIFKHLFNKSKVVIMLDGFDEICPHYKTVVTNFIIELVKTPIEQLWIGTRSNQQIELEGNLNQLSYSLEPFSAKTQIDLITKFWKKEFKLAPTCDESRMTLYARGLLEKLSKRIVDSTVFTGVPLQTRMIAETFSQEFNDFYFSEKSTTPALPEKLDMITLYERFLHNKYRIYVAEKNKPPNINLATKDLVGIFRGGVNLRKIHQQLALQVLFSRQEEVLPYMKKSHSLSQEQLNRVGIVQSRETNKMEFIHRTFAEYYAADFFTSQIVTERLVSVDFQKFLLRDILLKPEFQIIRVFFNGLLEKDVHSLSQNIFIKYGSQIELLWKSNSLSHHYKTVLFIAVEEGNLCIAKFLLNSLKGGKYMHTLNNMLLDKRNYHMHHGNRTVMFPAACDGRLDMLNLMWSWAKEAELNSKSDFHRLFLSHDEVKVTVWHAVAEQGSVDAFTLLYKCFIQVLDANHMRELFKQTDLFGRTVWHCSISSGNVAMFNKLRVIAEEVELKSKCLKEILLSVDKEGQNMWHYVANKEGNLNMLGNLMKWAKELQVEYYNLKEIFLGRDKNGRTVLQLAVASGSMEKMQKIWDIGQKINLDHKDLKLILLGKRDQFVYQEVVKMGRIDILKKLWEWTKELEFNNEELKDLVFTFHINRTNVWLLAVRNGSLDVLEMLWSITQEIHLTKCELKTMLGSPIAENGNAWYLSIQMQNILIMERLWTYLQIMPLSMEDLQDILVKYDNKNSLYLAVNNGNVEVIHKVLEILEKIFAFEELSDILMTGYNQAETLWYYTLSRQQPEVLNIILEWGEKKLSDKMLEQFWQAKSKYEEFNLLVLNWKGLSLENVLVWCKENLSLADFKGVILQKQLLGIHAWKLPWKGEEKIIQQILIWSKRNLTMAELIQLITTEDGSDSNLFRTIIEQGCMDMFIDLWNWDENDSLIRGFKILFTTHSFSWSVNTPDICSVLHYAMRRKDVVTLMNFWKWGERMRFTKNSYKHLLLDKDEFGDTFVHIIARLNPRELSMNALIKILNCVRTVVDLQDLTELLLLKNSNDLNILHLLVSSGRYNDLLELLEWCVNILPQDDFKQLMLDKDHRGATTLHLLSKKDVKAWFITIQWLKDNLDWDVFTELFLATNLGRNSMDIASKEVSKGIIKGTIDKEFRKKFATLNELKSSCKNEKVLCLLPGKLI